MRYKTVESVIEAAKERGFSIALEQGPPIQPVLKFKGNEQQRAKIKENANDALLTLVRAWRPEIIKKLQAEKPS